MFNNAHIFLSSSRLYHELYQTFFDGSDEIVQKSFDINENIQVRLINCIPEDGMGVNQDQSGNRYELAYMDDRYDILRDMPDSKTKTIWYNPAGEIVSDEMPKQDVDIGDLEDLKDVLKLLHKPGLDQCLDWWEMWDVPENIRRHSSVVAWSAYVLAMKMRDKGISVDPILAYRAGLLHDIDKIDTLKESGAHGNMGADFLDEQGYPEIGNIVRDHIMSTILHSDVKNRSWENKLVFFCDKLVEEDELVPFNERLAALKVRYPYYVEKMERAESAIWDLSDEICEVLDIPLHEGLIEMLREVL